MCISEQGARHEAAEAKTSPGICIRKKRLTLSVTPN